MVLVQKSIKEVSENNGISGLATRSVENAVQRVRAMAQVVEGINLIATTSERSAGS
jgi:hypothetical protein